MTEKPKKKMNIDQFLWMQNIMDTADAMDEPEYTPMDAPFEIVDEKRDIAPFSLLAPDKKELFTIHKPVRDITLEEVYTNVKKALSNITLEDYEHFKQETADLPSSLRTADRADERLGFASYLFAIAQTTGYVALAILKSPHPKGTAITQAVEITTKFFKLCTAITDKAYADKRKEANYNPINTERIQYPNDKITKNLTSGRAEEWREGIFYTNEKIKNKKIISTVQFDIEKMRQLGFTSYDAFDWLVLFTCISIQEAGNKKTTVNIIYRTMTGKSKAPSPAMQENILTSLNKLRIPVTINATGVCAAYGYAGKGDLRGRFLLPAYIDPGEIKGNIMDDVITFLAESPLMEIAKMKGKEKPQILSYPQEYLNVPINSNRQSVVIPPRLIMRIKDSVHGKLEKKIDIDNLIEECGWTGTRARLVSIIEKCFNYWMENKYLISAYKIKKNKRGKVVLVEFSPIE